MIMSNIYGGRLGDILNKYNKMECPNCKTKPVQLIIYNSGDPTWKCRHCKNVWSRPFTDTKDYNSTLEK